MDIDDIEGQEGLAIGPEGGESGQSDDDATGSSSKKKRKQPHRFYCQGYDGCTLSFTRSEHLARHIRSVRG
jgi:uncharacterized Zn-finger protein